jgi:hypothetical protein
MPGPHDFAVRFSAVRLRDVPSLTSFHPPYDATFRADAAASTASHPNVRDDRDTPLFGRGGMARINHLFLKNRSDLFFARGLDTSSGRVPVGQIS